MAGLSTQSLDKGRELNPQIVIDDTMVAKDNNREFYNSESNTHSCEDMSSINVSNDIVLCRSIHENISYVRLKEHLLCVPQMRGMNLLPFMRVCYPLILLCGNSNE